VLGWVTDGGLETDLIFHKGLELREFAAFPLVAEQSTAQVLLDYYADYASIAARAGAGLVLETPTWRANPEWAAVLGYDSAALAGLNAAAVDLVRRAGTGLDRVRISGVIGPRGDGYVPAGSHADEAAEYHSAQISTFASSGVDVVHAMTVNEPAEAIGIVRAARAAGVEVGISFTVETDGRLPDGTTLRDAVTQVDAAAAPDWYGINCAHPLHAYKALDDGAWQSRLQTFRPNASTMTHEELDAMEVLDEGDRTLLRSSTDRFLQQVPSVTTLGGCCGTDATHVASLWHVGN
jgi:S-methylmethionine-dependent homocysteine/selenocysteine methylase